MSVIIRNACTKDLPAIQSILNHEIENSFAVYDYTAKDNTAIAEWFKNKQDEKYPVIVAEHNQNVIGFASLGTFRPWQAFKTTVEHSVYVSQNTRGLGVGKKLLEALIKIAKEQGYHAMVAGIDATNTKSIAFHKNYQFKEVGRLKEIAFKHNTWLDLVFLQKLL